MPSASPAGTVPPKRPSLAGRSSSTIALSSSGKPQSLTGNAGGAGAGAGTAKRPHLVSRHTSSRNVSHGRALSNMGKKSMAAVHGEAAGVRNHKRSKSGNITPVASPNPSTGGGGYHGHMKRNSSHAVLPKNRSHGNLRKNQSTSTLTALNRNLSRGALNKLGAPAEQKAKQEAQQKQGVFDLADDSEEEEEEAEWEDSTASPELTRNNSKVSTPARAHTPVQKGEPIQKPPEEGSPLVPEKTSSPPEPETIKSNKSAPDLRFNRTFSADHPRQDPSLLQHHQNGRGSRAPPAMTTANAHSSQQHLFHNDSQTVLTKSTRTSLEASQTTDSTGTTGKTPQIIGIGSSGSAGVSHFLINDPSLPRTPRDRVNDSSDDESVNEFMSTYKPLLSESPDKPRMNINKARLSSQPSRTQQKLDLERNRGMRGTGPPASLAASAGSSVSLHSRTYSQGQGKTMGRSKSMVGEVKAIKQEYDTAIKQLTVVRRFKNPVLESLARLKHAGAIPDEGKPNNKANGETTKRPPSRHGRVISQTRNTINGTPHTGTTPDDTRSMRSSKVSFANNGRPSEAQPRHADGRDNHVTFQLSRQDSHDDMLTTSRGSPEVDKDEYNLADGLSLEEALIRRMWESRIHVTA